MSSVKINVVSIVLVYQRYWQMHYTSTFFISVYIRDHNFNSPLLPSFIISNSSVWPAKMILFVISLHFTTVVMIMQWLKITFLFLSGQIRVIWNVLASYSKRHYWEPMAGPKAAPNLECQSLFHSCPSIWNSLPKTHLCWDQRINVHLKKLLNGFQWNLVGALEKGQGWAYFDADRDKGEFPGVIIIIINISSGITNYFYSYHYHHYYCYYLIHTVFYIK